MAVLFAWTNRASDKLSYESLRLATELPDNELRRTLWVFINIFLLFFYKFKFRIDNLVDLLAIYIYLATGGFSKNQTSSAMLRSRSKTSQRLH